MTTPFIGEIQIFGFDYPPYGWALANGALFMISQNSALFSLIGTYYGGDGRNNFRLPNLTARIPIGQGTGPGLSPRNMGDALGESAVMLIQTEMPMHGHEMHAYPQAATSPGPVAGAGLAGPRSTRMYSPDPTPNTYLYPEALSISGGSQPHENRQPSLALNYSIALYGEYPRFS